ncbi:MAG: WD40/YVTN/BNR-like repeat-containing protein, partial [bacterium]
GFGTAGHTMHTVLYDPAAKGRIYFVSSAGGAYRSDDDGATWARIREGTMTSCTEYTKDTEQGTVAQHLEQVHGCTHRLALAPQKGGTTMVYQQNHCGLYKSENAGDTWQDISGNIRSRHGFPIAFTDGKKPAVWVVPADQEGKCKKHNSCIRRELEVWRSTDRGASWRSFSMGLPKKVHTCVLRHGMHSDKAGGVYFGTTTGEVYGLESGADSWQLIANGLSRIQGIVAA